MIVQDYHAKKENVGVHAPPLRPPPQAVAYDPPSPMRVLTGGRRETLREYVRSSALVPAEARPKLIDEIDNKLSVDELYTLLSDENLVVKWIDSRVTAE
jgi:hypothetical protein